VGKINSTTNKILLTLTLTHLYLVPDLITLLVVLLIFPTLDSHSNSFVSTACQAVDTNELE
jgi:hypothetical protein